ncbi:MAG: 50S ribosomal protein L19e [Candidatus Diapherotrites archaeon]|uniref:Large ribosomal subunit protein eL19 n=1 Tax=Candidatus Iainarchaeum sp. TaxID=3101447 RepID=A0A939C5Y5_9ARCH|nr:50S ribosomal protein L19e [Candidatus Diapherotrites archaeon]
MKADKVRRMAAQVLKAANKDVWFDSGEMEKIESVMTKEDIRGLIKEGVIKKRKKQSQSRGRSRLLKEKKKKGRKRGKGKRKGRKNARKEGKKQWEKNVRSQRKMLKELKKEKPEAVKKIGYRKLYKMVKGGFFRGKHYLKASVEGKKR